MAFHHVQNLFIGLILILSRIFARKAELNMRGYLKEQCKMPAFVSGLVLLSDACLLLLLLLLVLVWSTAAKAANSGLLLAVLSGSITQFVAVCNHFQSWSFYRLQIEMHYQEKQAL